MQLQDSTMKVGRGGGGGGGGGGGSRGDRSNGGQRDAMMGEGGSDSKTGSKSSVLLQFVPPAQVSAGRNPSAAGGHGGVVAVAEHPVVASCVQAGALPLHIEGVQDLEGLGAEVKTKKGHKRSPPGLQNPNLHQKSRS